MNPTIDSGRAVWLASLLGLMGCSAASTEPEQPGSCSLSCSNPMVPDNSYTIEPLLQMEGLELACEADFSTNRIVPLGGPISLKFIVKKKGAGGGEAGAEGEEAGLQAGEQLALPVPGIGFEPYVIGGVSVENSNDEFKNGDGTVTPFKYAGIVTPRAEWCSDSCGVMSYEVWPVCIEGGENAITAGIVSGGIQSAPLSITISNGTDEEDEGG